MATYQGDSELLPGTDFLLLHGLPQLLFPFQERCSNRVRATEEWNERDENWGVSPNIIVTDSQHTGRQHPQTRVTEFHLLQKWLQSSDLCHCMLNIDYPNLVNKHRTTSSISLSAWLHSNLHVSTFPAHLQEECGKTTHIRLINLYGLNTQLPIRLPDKAY